MKGERETSTMKEGLTQKKEVERERERKRVNCSGRRRGREKAGRKKRMRQIIRIHELRFLVTYCLYLFLLTLVMMGGGGLMCPPKVFLFFYQKSLPLTKPLDPPVNS
mgnify:CR=1 FL=1